MQSFEEWWNQTGSLLTPTRITADIALAAWEAARKEVRERHAANLDDLAGNTAFDGATRRVLAMIAHRIRNATD